MLLLTRHLADALRLSVHACCCPRGTSQTFLDWVVCMWSIGTMDAAQLSELLWDACAAEARSSRAECLLLTQVKLTIEEVRPENPTNSRHIQPLVP